MALAYMQNLGYVYIIMSLHLLHPFSIILVDTGIDGIPVESLHPIKDKIDLFTATQGIGDWTTLCIYLGAGEGVMNELKHSTKQPIEKKQECLTDVFNNGVLNWETVVRVVAHHLRNLNLACDIAKKYMRMERQECVDVYKHNT